MFKKLVDEIVRFERSNRTLNDYIQLFIVVARAFRQGSGLGGKEISDAITEALQEVGRG